MEDDDPRIEYLNTPKRKRGRLFKLMLGMCLFGGAVGSLELYKAANEKFKHIGKRVVSHPERDINFMKEEDHDKGLREAGCEQRIKHIRNVLHQEVSADFHSSLKNYDSLIQKKKENIQAELVRL